MTVTKHINTAHLDATGVAHTGPGVLKRVIVYTGGTLSVKCYDNVAGTTNPITPELAVDMIGADIIRTESFEVGARFDTGLRCAFTGAGECVVVFE